jgi:putative transposase
MTSDIEKLNTVNSLLELVSKHGINDLAPVIETLLNQAMKIERENAVQAGNYERTEDRKGYCNGYKERNFNSRLGSLRIQIPQVRGLSFYPQSLEKGERSEKALKLSIAEMYVNGVSTRKVAAITEALCGTEISSTQVSRCAKLLDEGLEAFRNRPLNGKYKYVYLDAIYEKIRHCNSVMSMATLVAIGVNEDGKREILGISAKLSEAEVHWRDFILSLTKRGLSGVELIISDAHEGLCAARKAVLPSAKWQRCQFHMAQNAQSYAPKKSMKVEVAEAVRGIFNSSNVERAREEKKRVVDEFADKAPEFSTWIDENIEEGFACYNFPKAHQKKIRTSNTIERQNREIRRRTNVVSIFPNVASAERLITALLQDIHENWITGRVYLNMSLTD